MFKRISVFIAVAAAVSAVAVAQEVIQLKLNVAKDQVFAYKMTVNVEFQGMPITVTGKTINTATKVEKDSITWKNESKETTIDIGGGQTMEQPDSESMMVQSLDGKILKMEGEAVTPEANRLANAFNFAFPAKGFKVGDKYEATVPADKDLGTEEIAVSYTFKEVKEVKGKKCVVIVFSHQEKTTDGIVANGTAVVDLKTGMPVSVEATFKNMQQQGMMFDGTYKTEQIN
ncbi:MAG: hypothetical protein KF836_02635 [Fimbriimonadaceae bacterium]|nr:hypothetical protein [Fimbriimonadaceae bacterium]